MTKCYPQWTRHSIHTYILLQTVEFPTIQIASATLEMLVLLNIWLKS